MVASGQEPIALEYILSTSMPSNKPEFSPSTTWLSVVEGISFPSASCRRDLPSSVVQILSFGSLSYWWDNRGSCGQVSHSCNTGVHLAVCSNSSSSGIADQKPTYRVSSQFRPKRDKFKGQNCVWGGRHACQRETAPRSRANTS